MPLGLRLKVRLTESDGCMTKSQRLNTHHLPQRVKGLSDLRGEAPFFRLWECFFEFSHTFRLICFRLKEIKSAITLMTLLVLVCINCCFFFFIVHYKPSICEEANCIVKCSKPFFVCFSYKCFHIQELSQSSPQHEL